MYQITGQWYANIQLVSFYKLLKFFYLVWNKDNIIYM